MSFDLSRRVRYFRLGLHNLRFDIKQIVNGQVLNCILSLEFGPLPLSFVNIRALLDFRLRIHGAVIH